MINNGRYGPGNFNRTRRQPLHSADRVAAYEEIGRRIAPRIGGYPIKVRLIDAAQTVRAGRAAGPLSSCPEPPSGAAPTMQRNLLAYGEM